MAKQVNAAQSRKPWSALGLTGGIACGKSTAARFFQAQGALIIDADEIAHAAVARGSPLLQRIVDSFRTEIGAHLLLASGELNRALLGRAVFADEHLRKRLEALLHPDIVAAIDRQVDAAFLGSWDRDVIVVVPLLFETGLSTHCACTLTIACDEEQQIKRLHERDGFDRRQALQRIASQMPQKDKKRLATWEIKNTASPQEFEKQLESLWPKIQRALSDARRANV